MFVDRFIVKVAQQMAHNFALFVVARDPLPTLILALIISKTNLILLLEMREKSDHAVVTFENDADCILAIIIITPNVYDHSFDDVLIRSGVRVQAEDKQDH